MKARLTQSATLVGRRSTTSSLLPAAVFSVVLILLGQDTSAQPSFQGVGDLPGGTFWSQAYAVSADGTTVVGSSRHLAEPTRLQAFRWTEQDGIVGLGFLSDANESIATDVSSDGSVIVGRGFVSLTTIQYVGFRWTEATGAVSLGYLPSPFNWYGSAEAVSADGSVVVGRLVTPSDGPRQAFRWKATTGMQRIGFVLDTEAYAVSADGFAAAGSASPLPFFWHMAIGGDYVTSNGILGIYDMTPDAEYSVGVGNGGSGNLEAYRWRYETNSIVYLGDLAGGSFSSWAFAISADHQTVVGRSSAGGGTAAFIWKEGGTMQRLQDVLVNDHGLDLTGWTLREARDISDDGLTIVGFGINPDGNTEGWVAKLTP